MSQKKNYRGLPLCERMAEARAALFDVMPGIQQTYDLPDIQLGDVLDEVRAWYADDELALGYRAAPLLPPPPPALAAERRSS